MNIDIAIMISEQKILTVTNDNIFKFNPTAFDFLLFILI